MILILISWVLVAHTLGEFLDHMVRLEMKNEKAKATVSLWEFWAVENGP